MLCEIVKLWRVLIFLLVFSYKLHWIVNGELQVPCFFIFGDSLSDSGNNNNLQTTAKVNYLPYGIDYPGGPSGRFTNGKNVVDVVAEYLGFDHHIPPFASADGQIILQGVNYASGSAGIREETGSHLGQNIHFNQQLQNHQITITRMGDILGNKDAALNQLKQCLYSVGMGSNDYLNNYFMPERYPTSKTYTTPEAYAKALVEQYSTQLMTLYNMGARKIALNGLGHIGCTPYGITKFAESGSPCAANLNQASDLFNGELVGLVNQLNKNLTDAKFIFVNNTSTGKGDPYEVGFTNFTAACCKVREDGQCNPNEDPCPNRQEYVFWDNFHPTEVTNILTAGRTYTSYDPSDVYPVDVRQLALLRLPLANTEV